MSEDDYLANRDAAYLKWMTDNQGKKTPVERIAFVEGFEYGVSSNESDTDTH